MADHEDLGNLSTFKVHVNIFPFADGTLRLLELTRPRCLETQPRENFVADDAGKGEETISDENGESLWSVSGDFFQRHREVSRLKLFVPKDETCLLPVICVGVTRQTQTSTDKTSEHTLNDYWNAETDFAPFEG